MNIVIPLIISTAIFSQAASRSGTVTAIGQVDAQNQVQIAYDLPSDPYDPPKDRGNPHGGNPHGGDPHDENHDPGLPSNGKELERHNPDPYGGAIPPYPPS